MRKIITAAICMLSLQTFAQSHGQLGCIGVLNKDLEAAKDFGTFSHPKGSKSLFDFRKINREFVQFKKRQQEEETAVNEAWKSYENLKSKKIAPLYEARHRKLADLNNQMSVAIIETQNLRKMFDARVGKNTSELIDQLDEMAESLAKEYETLAKSEIPTETNDKTVLAAHKKYQALVAAKKATEEEFSAKREKALTDMGRTGSLYLSESDIYDEAYILEPGLKDLSKNANSAVTPGLRVSIEKENIKINGFLEKNKELLALGQMGRPDCEASLKGSQILQEAMNACKKDVAYIDKNESKFELLSAQWEAMMKEYYEKYGIYFGDGTESAIVYVKDGKVAQYLITTKRPGSNGSYNIKLNSDCSGKQILGSPEVIGLKTPKSIRNRDSDYTELMNSRYPSNNLKPASNANGGKKPAVTK